MFAFDWWLTCGLTGVWVGLLLCFCHKVVNLFACLWLSESTFYCSIGPGWWWLALALGCAFFIIPLGLGLLIFSWALTFINSFEVSFPTCTILRVENDLILTIICCVNNKTFNANSVTPHTTIKGPSGDKEDRHYKEPSGDKEDLMSFRPPLLLSFVFLGCLDWASYLCYCTRTPQNFSSVPLGLSLVMLYIAVGPKIKVKKNELPYLPIWLIGNCNRVIT